MKQFRAALTLWVLIISGILSAGFPLYAQYGMSNARSVAMGGAYTALARGVEAPGWNPANLALPKKGRVQINLVSIGLGFHNNSFNKDHYDLYNGRFLTEQDKQDILAAIPQEGLRLNFDTEAQALGINIGAFAVTASGLAASDMLLSKDIADLALNGNELDRIYEIGDSVGEGWSALSVGVSAAFPLSMPMFEKFAVGGSVKYLQGFAFGKVRQAESNIITTAEGAQGDGIIVIDRSYGGNGLGLDVGAAAQLNERLSVSLGMMNVFNYINWNESTKRFTYTFLVDSLTVEKVEDTDIDSVFIDSDETIAIEPFTTSLPSQIRFGMAYTTRRLTLAADVKQGLNSVAGINSKPELALGTELRLIGVLPLRAGISAGGVKGFSAAAGFALDFSIMSLDFALANRGGTFNGKGLTFAFDWMFRF